MRETHPMEETDMSKPNRTPVQARIARSAAIRRDRRHRTEGLGGKAASAPAKPGGMLAACIAAGGFDQNAAY